MTEGRVYKVEFTDPFEMVITYFENGSMKQWMTNGGTAAQSRADIEAVLKALRSGNPDEIEAVGWRGSAK